MSYNYATHNENGGGEKSTSTASGVTTTAFTDLLGRSSKTVSSANGTTLYAYYPLDAAPGSRGQLASVTDGDGVVTRYGYNAEGERSTTSRSIPLADGSTILQASDGPSLWEFQLMEKSWRRPLPHLTRLTWVGGRRLDRRF